jgi:hypothetical protein
LRWRCHNCRCHYLQQRYCHHQAPKIV